MCYSTKEREGIEMEKVLFISGVVSLISGVFIFLFVFKVLKPLLKNEDAERKYHSWLFRNTSKAKGLAFLLTVFGIMVVIKNNPDLSTENTTASSQSRTWTDNDKASLTNECVRMYVTQEQIPDSDVDIAENYCQCTTEKMTEEFSIGDLLSHDSLSQVEKIQLYEPVVKNCLNDLEFQLNERYSQGEMSIP